MNFKVLLKKYFIYVILIVIISLSTLGYVYRKQNKKVESPRKESLIMTTKKEVTQEKKKTVFVDVKGSVINPGVYELDDDKRIIDAILLAGGFSETADSRNINLGKKLTDEMTIIVYSKSELLAYKKEDKKNDISCVNVECICPDTNNDACINQANNKDNLVNKTGKVSINNATKEELMTLSGIGEAKAVAIIKYRDENGGFKTLDDLKKVTGIGDSMYEKIKDNITL